MPVTRRACAVLAAAALATTVCATAAEAAPSPLVFARFQADAGGSRVKDTAANVNGEWIQVRNTTGRAIDVTGYTIRDAHNNRFVFPRGSVIGARATVTVYTGKGANGGGRFYWKQGFHKWNNTGDTAILLTPRGARLAACTYRKNPAGVVGC